MMKKVIFAATLFGASLTAHAEAVGGPGCGWGNMLLAGQSGLPMHILASTTNGTSGNATFGMTTGTNGCTTGKLTYSGKSLLAMQGVMEEVAQDMAVGKGEALTALSVSMGIPSEERDHFNAVMHQNFSAVFTSEKVTAGEVADNINAVMQKDEKLAKFI